ncbi:YceI family protein [Chitinophaga sp. Cy-1792]|uniref:YceI family protein n=1 Tax=Chitinophaga sp. Cy-1792 TaxID=2608339 RepID=UPI001420BA3E|nr:YceI family protein [Chitinophaga sp. Cy-1792]NIG52880.1 YceI family protein [Chitinophaga sp. Cy-1792]
MKRFLMLALCMALSIIGYSQDIVTAKGATISFYSSAPLEDIEAKSTQAVSAINIKTRAINFQVPITSFEFEESLMQEHFNSEYMESGKYPNSVFNGKITDNVDLSKDGTYNVTVTGTLNLHGVSKAYTVKATIVAQGGALKANAKFNVRLADHNIKIPTIIVKNIAEVVAVTVNGTYMAMGK